MSKPIRLGPKGVEPLAELDLGAVVNEDLGYHACHLGLDLVHQLHGLDNADGLTLVDPVSDLDEWRRVLRRPPVEDADKR